MGVLYLIAETDNIQNLQHGWNYTMRKLIENYKENCYQKGIGEDLHSIKLIPFYKFTYCNKELSTEEEQKMTWTRMAHLNKIYLLYYYFDLHHFY